METVFCLELVDKDQDCREADGDSRQVRGAGGDEADVEHDEQLAAQYPATEPGLDFDDLRRGLRYRISCGGYGVGMGRE